MTESANRLSRNRAMTVLRERSRAAVTTHDGPRAVRDQASDVRLT